MEPVPFEELWNRLKETPESLRKDGKLVEEKGQRGKEI